MKEYGTDALRNLAFVGHGGSGKTSLADALLFIAGGSNRLGRVDDGTSQFDFDEEEKKRKLTIRSSLGFVEWKKSKINFLDTPGYADFIGDVVAALQVTDAVVVLVDAQAGVEVGTDRVWRYAKSRSLPAFFCVNKVDREHADFAKAYGSIRERLADGAVAVTIPLNEGEGFDGVIDVLRMKAFRYPSDGSGKGNPEEIPADAADRAREARERLVEQAAETDDSLVEKYLDGGELTEEEILRGLKAGIAAGTLYPVFAVSTGRNMGTDLLLDRIAESGPSPANRSEIVSADGEQKRKPSESEPLAALAFKTVSEAHMGELTYFRVFSGEMKASSEPYNPRTEKPERIGQLFYVRGRERVEATRLTAGDFGAGVKLKETKTGDTLCEPGGDFVLPAIPFPKPVIRSAVIAINKGEEDKIGNGLARLQEEDPTFRVVHDKEVRQTLLHGLGEMHLDILVQKLKERFNVGVELIKPRIPYKETIRGKAEVQGRYKKQTGGRGQFGDVWLRIEPQPRGVGFEFVDAVVGGVVPNKFIPAVEKGVVAAMEEGVVAGYKVVDVKVSLYDGSHHPVDSSENSFKVAGSMAFKKGFLQANPILLEPIYEVKVTVPEEYMGDVMGDLSSRRGKILGMDSEGGFQVLRARVPLAELYKYSTNLRSLTQGRGLYEREFSTYEEVPKDFAEKVIAEAQAAKEEA
ncbi:MAG: elongation factor G [Candidatus Eisenbacteria bacterium]|nr:elongation factor G [Candidatus Eisenbacteria bacterium]